MACKGCSGKNSDQLQWCGIYWFGVPKPVRIARRLRELVTRRHHPRKPYTGCGCPVVTRDAWTSVQAGYKHYRALRSVRLAARTEVRATVRADRVVTP